MMPRLVIVTVAILGVCVSGCADKDIASDRVRASNYREFNWWRGQVSRDVPPARWAEFNGAVDEIRYDLMAQGITGADAIGEALARRINTLTIDEVLREGDRVKLARLQSVRDQLKEMIDGNALVGTKTDDEASREAMERRTAEQRDRLDGILRQMADVRQQFIVHGGKPPPDPAFDRSPANLARDQARADYLRLIRQRRENAMLMYGDWPARIDRSGADLPPDVRTEFDRRRGLAAANRHTVIPVYIRAKWRLYDDVVPYPEFSAAVTANLTAHDRRELETAWADSEAEVWARREAQKESADTVISNIKADLKNAMRP